MKMKNWDQLKKELLKDPVVAKEYNRLAPEYAVISQLIAIRAEKKLTQKELAKSMGTKQSAIARLESGNYNPTLEFLQKTAEALGRKLTINFE
jgi:predicted transcriptional regulator